VGDGGDDEGDKLVFVLWRHTLEWFSVKERHQNVEEEVVEKQEGLQCCSVMMKEL